MIDVTIVIPVKNGGKLLEECLAMIAKQQTNLNFEVICVDSGSKDNSVEIIKGFGFELYEIAPSDFGHGKTRNFGAFKGSGKFIVFITQDAIPANEFWLDNLVKPMVSDSNIVGAFGKHLPHHDCNLFDIRDLKNHFLWFERKNKIIQLEDKKRYENDTSYRNYITFFSDNNSCVRRSVFEKKPYADVQFAEDQIWMKARMEEGYKKVYVKDAAVHHSHNFNKKDYLGRYYDEYKGIYDFSGYRIATSAPQAFVRYLRSVRQDISYLRSIPLTRKDKFKWLYYSIWRNRCKYLGGYLGGKYHLYPSAKQNRLDKKYSQQFKQRNN